MVLLLVLLLIHVSAFSGSFPHFLNEVISGRLLASNECSVVVRLHVNILDDDSSRRSGFACLPILAFRGWSIGAELVV